MKKTLLFILIALLVVACSQPHKYHTYFGDIDTDTIEVAFIDIKDGLPCYLVHVKDIDSIEKAPGVWGYLYGPLKYYYCPAKDVYYHTVPDNHGKEILRGYNPYTNNSYLPTDF